MSSSTIAFVVVLALCAVSSSLAFTCPDGTSICPEGSSCCILSSGYYGCCPLPNASCCADHIHCCPSGYTCDLTDNTCHKGSLKLAAVAKFPAATAATTTASPGPKNLEYVICPDGISVCSDGQTCCVVASGEYACCPLANATCCPDKLHCCPNGYTCNTVTNTCSLQGALPTPMLAKVPAMSIKSIKGSDAPDADSGRTINSHHHHDTTGVSAPEIIVCPDGSYCSDGQTCCVLGSGDYACCPFPSADCCADKLHCCPSGYSCNTVTNTCQLGLFRLPAGRAQPARKPTKIVATP